MRWVTDSTGRFRLRPYYDQQELDYECQRLVTSFLSRRYGKCRFPLSTDDLTILIEQDTSDLDLYVDLSPEGDDVAGLTAFFPNRKPAVSVARELSVDSNRSGCLRTTLAHEYGHVKFHAFLWDFGTNERSVPGVLSKIHDQRWRYSRFRDTLVPRHGVRDSSPSLRFLGESTFPTGHGVDLNFRCNRSSILDAPVSDWMEWQASYVCGAILMPLSALQTVVRASTKECSLCNPPLSHTDLDKGLVSRVAEAFDVSFDAARLRLEKLRFLQGSQSPQSPQRDSPAVLVS